MMKSICLFVGICVYLSTPTFAYDPYADGNESGFVTAEGGVWILLGLARNTLDDPMIINVNLKL